MSPRTRTDILVAVGDDELAARAQQGQVLAERVLLERYRRIAGAKRRGSFLVGGDGEDVEQEAMIGLHKAIRDYRPDHGASFRVFAELCVSRQLASAIKAASRQKHQALNRSVSLSGPPDVDRAAGAATVEALLWRHHLPDPLEHVLVAERTVALRATVAAVLSPLEAQVLGLHLEGWSYREVADRLGRSVKAVDNALQRAKRKAEAHLAEPAGGAPSLAS